MFIPDLEQTRYAFLVRPRRFGKSLFTAMLHAYYDVNYDSRFDELFTGTWIHANPTKDRGKYLCLRFDFSGINKDVADAQFAFNKYCRGRMDTFLWEYEKYLPFDSIETIKNEQACHDQLDILERELAKTDYKLYIFIDEYDNYTNTLLADSESELYKILTQGKGFFKNFFTNLKKMTSGNSNVLQRLYITGVSPITMDDVSSGFNIGTNISLAPKFSSMLGFTEKDISEMIDYYRSTGRLLINKDEMMFELKKWYDNYRFSEKAKESVFNSTGILSVMFFSMDCDSLPRDIIDENLRMDSSKLKQLVYQGTNLNGNFDVLSEIINIGGISSNVHKSFPFKMLKETENYISLLYFLGFLTFSGENFYTDPYLCVPNETIKHLVYDYFRSIMKESLPVNNWSYELNKLSRNMAFQNDYKSILDYIAKLINHQTSIRDFKEGEDVVKTFHNVYLRVNDIYYTKTEYEMNKGYADIVLFPNFTKYPAIKYAYLIEVKYIKRSTSSAKNKRGMVRGGQSKLNEIIDEAIKQLNEYSKDHPSRKEYHLEPFGPVHLTKLIVVYQGWEMVYCEEIIDN